MENNSVKNKVTLGKDAISLSASKVIIALISMVTSMLLARFRTLEEYGTYSQIIMVTDLVTTILLLGLPNSINYFLAKADAEEERQKFLSVYLTISTILTAIIGVCLFLSMPLIISYFNNPYITTFAYIFAIYPWSSLMINSLSNTCIIYGKAQKLVVFNIIHAIISLIILLAARFTGISFQLYMAIYMSYTLLTALFSVAWIRKMSGRILPKFDKDLLKVIFAFSIPLGLASVVGTLNVELDKLVIGKFFTTDEYAIFANAAKELPVTMLATSLTAVMMPHIVRLLKDNKNREATEKWGSAIILSLSFMCVIVGGFIVFAPDVMSLLYSEKYVTEGGVLVFRIYSFVLLLRVTYWGIILNASGNSKKIMISSIITLILNFAGNILFYYIIGFIGPAVSTFISVLIMNVVQLVWTSRIINIKVIKMLPWMKMLKLIFETLAIGTVVAIIKYIFLPQYQRSISIIISICLGALWMAIFILINRKNIKRDWKNLST